MQSPELDPKKFKLNFKTALEAVRTPPAMKRCKNPECGVLIPIIGKMIGAHVECPECHSKYVLRQEIVLKTVIDPVEVE